MQFFNSIHFYERYFLDYWLHKIKHLKYAYENSEVVFENIHGVDSESTEAMFKNYLLLDLHSTYYSLIETLLTFTYLLSSFDEKNIWCKIADTDTSIYGKIERLARNWNEQDFSLLESKRKIEDGKEVQFFDYLFFRGINFKDKDQHEKSIQNIKKILSTASKDYLRKESHNAVKHLMHALNTGVDLEFGQDLGEKYDDFQFKDSLMYYHKSKDKRKVKVTFKKIDFDNEYFKAQAVCALIINIIQSRKRFYFKGKPMSFHPFVRENMDDFLSWNEDIKYDQFSLDINKEKICN